MSNWYKMVTDLFMKEVTVVESDVTVNFKAKMSTSTLVKIMVLMSLSLSIGVYNVMAPYRFNHTHYMDKIAPRDIIDSKEKEYSILMDNTIIKGNPVQIGAAVANDGGVLDVIKKSKVDTLIKYYVKPPYIDYTDGYVFTTNAFLAFPILLQGRRINSLLEVYKINRDIPNIAHPLDVKVGNWIVLNLDGTYYATVLDGFSIVHKNDPSKDRILMGSRQIKNMIEHRKELLEEE